MAREVKDKPGGLSELGEKAYSVISEYLVEKGRTYTGGCDPFYSPTEWRERGERFGTESELVVVYDGGDLQGISWDEELVRRLKAVGLFFEDCTSWYAAVYRI
jgi:hypothetical protein